MLSAIPAKHLLVYADDDPDDLQMVEAALLPFRDLVEVRLFENGSDAYHHLLLLKEAGAKPCLVVLDMNMPGLSGRELLPLLRRDPYFGDVSLVLFTTSSSEHDRRFARDYRAAFITKPMTHTHMEDAVKQLLTHCSPDIRKVLER